MIWDSDAGCFIGFGLMVMFIALGFGGCLYLVNHL